jgi:hypothetical protein
MESMDGRVTCMPSDLSTQPNLTATVSSSIINHQVILYDILNTVILDWTASSYYHIIILSYYHVIILY